MKKFKIIVDSLCTMPIDIAKELDIKKIQYSINDSKGNIITDDFSRKLLNDVVSQINKDNFFKSSMYSPTLIEEEINKFLEEYEQVLYICASTHYTSQYESTKYIQEKNKDRVFIVDSNNICTNIEEIAYKITDFYKNNEKITQDDINLIIKNVNNNTTTLFIPKYLDGLIHSGRIPSSLIKLLKLAKVTPIIKSEEKNKPCKLIKNTTGEILKLLNAFDEIFGKKLKDNLIKTIYIFDTIISKEKLNEIKKVIQDYYNVKIEKIQIRLTPLPVAIYTLKESFGIAIHALTNRIK